MKFLTRIVQFLFDLVRRSFGLLLLGVIVIGAGLGTWLQLAHSPLWQRSVATFSAIVVTAFGAERLINFIFNRGKKPQVIHEGSVGITAPPAPYVPLPVVIEPPPPPTPIPSDPIDPMLLAIPLRGREATLNAVRVSLTEGRPVFIVGVGGLGKSRLAYEIYRNHTGLKVWHRCSDVSRADSIIQDVGRRLGLSDTTERAIVLTQVKGALVVIDNAEDVPAQDMRRLDYVTLIRDLMAAGAQVLITSRVGWDEIQPLREHRPNRIDPTPAAQIVLDMADALDIQADLQPHAAAFAEAALCHPKLIEMALPILRRKPLEAVLDQLRRLENRGDLNKALDEMVNKTLRQMIESETAGAQAAAVLKRLNVCRGGFTYAAAQAIAIVGDDADFVRARHAVPLPDAAPETDDHPANTDDLDAALRTLQTWRFVTYDPRPERYSIDPLVIAAVGEDESAHRPHYAFYHELAKAHHYAQDYLGLDVESDNLEAAFEWAVQHGDGEDALWLSNACGSFLPNRGRFAQMLDWSERVVKALEDHPDKMLWANAMNSLGVDYKNFPLGDRRENLRRAIEAYTRALEFLTREAAPQYYATTQNNLGNAYGDLAEIEDRAENLRLAIEAYTRALDFYTREAAPLDYAMTQNNLGIAYRNLSEIEDRAENLRLAIEAYNLALEFRTPQAAPQSYAMTQNNLGIAYWSLSAVEDAATGWAENLRRAIEAYTRALEFRTREAAPLDYAATQNNLGNAYGDLAEIEDPVENFKKAIDAYTRALEFRTPQAAPLDYATTRYNMGNTYRDLSSIENREANLRLALAAYDDALTIRTPENHPIGYANAQNNKGLVHKDLGEIERALVCWREAVRVYRLMGMDADADRAQRLIDKYGSGA